MLSICATITNSSLIVVKDSEKPCAEQIGPRIPNAALPDWRILRPRASPLLHFGARLDHRQRLEDPLRPAFDCLLDVLACILRHSGKRYRPAKFERTADIRKRFDREGAVLQIDCDPVETRFSMISATEALEAASSCRPSAVLNGEGYVYFYSSWQFLIGVDAA